MSPVRITIFVKKLDSITEEAFHTYWSESHPAIFLSVPTAQRLLLKYSQYHISQPLTTAIRTAAGAASVESEYSGAAEFWVASLDDFGAIFADPKYTTDVIQDEETFINRGESLLFVGEEQPKWNATQM